MEQHSGELCQPMPTIQHLKRLSAENTQPGKHGYVYSRIGLYLAYNLFQCYELSQEAIAAVGSVRTALEEHISIREEFEI